MSNVNPVSTQIVQGQASAQSALSGNAKGVFAAGGMTFWDFLLGGSMDGSLKQNAVLSLTDQATTSPDATMTLPGEGMDVLLENLQGLEGFEGIEDAAALDGDSSLSMMELALFLKGQNGKLSADNLADLRIERVQKQIDQINKLVSHLSNGMPDSAKNDAMLDTLISRLDQQLEKLEAKLEEMKSGKTLAEDSNFPLLIALGLTPAQMAKITERIDEVEKKLGRELTVEDLIAGVANIVPPPQDQTDLLVPVAANGEVDLTSLPDDAEPTDALAAQLNGLIVGVGSNGDDLQIEGLEGGADKRVMRGIELIQKIMAGAQAAGVNAQKAGDVIKAGFSSLLNLAGVQGDVTLPTGWYNALASGIDFSSFDIQAGLPLTTAAQAAHVTTSVQQAGHAHPATQLVSAQLTKAAKEGGPKTMTIQMDPPELGRVDVRLEFGPEKTIKAHLVVEKIETYHMLQRDAAYLDRALQNAGLDTSNGSSLSFELARDGSTFDQQNQGGDGSRSGASQPGGNTETDEIIQSTMTWQVDPGTGHVRYNILA